MDNKSISNAEFFDMKQNGKIVIAEEKIKWEFIKKYTFISLVAFIIYKINLFIVDEKFIKLFNDFKITISSAKNYIENVNNHVYQTGIICLIMILFNFLIVFLSSKLIFKKYKIKKEYINQIMKIIIIIEMIFTLVLLFEFTVAYINETYNSIHQWRIEKLLNNNNIEKINYFANKIKNIYLERFIILSIINIFCSITCTFLQKKIIEKNILK